MLKYSENQIFILVDDNTKQYCLPFFQTILKERFGWNVEKSHILNIAPGEEHKTLDTVSSLWHILIDHKVTRKALLFNLGGGVITDLGGFVASTYRRGIDYINVPTTLLSMVDAGFGGKTGFDFKGLKNAIGVFNKPIDTWIFSIFLKTLPKEELLSGYAEMVKHALLSDINHFNNLIEKIDIFLDIANSNNEDLMIAEQIIWESIKIKQNIVDIDPNENGVRKSLNLGHTIGHALEELSLKRNTPIPHGFTVMHGLVAELFISNKIKGLNEDVCLKLKQFFHKYYTKIQFEYSDFEKLFEYMLNDKKNRTATEINFTLLSIVGRYDVDNAVSRDIIEESLMYLKGIDNE